MAVLSGVVYRGAQQQFRIAFSTFLFLRWLVSLYSALYRRGPICGNRSLQAQAAQH